MNIVKVFVDKYVLIENFQKKNQCLKLKMILVLGVLQLIWIKRIITLCRKYGEIIPLNVKKIVYLFIM